MKAKHQQDVIDQDVIDWLRAVPAVEFNSSLLELSPLAKLCASQPSETPGFVLTTWGVLRIAYAQAFGAPVEEKPKEDIGDHTVIDFLKQVTVADFSQMVADLTNDYDDIESLGIPQNVWGAIKWIMHDRDQNARFGDAAGSFKHLTPARAQ
jgi:hypothetical protein